MMMRLQAHSGGCAKKPTFAPEEILFRSKRTKSSYLVEQVRKKIPAKGAAEIQLERWGKPNKGFM